MALLLNDDDMNRMLEEIRPEGEQYIGKAWGTITGGTARIPVPWALFPTFPVMWADRPFFGHCRYGNL